MNKKFKTDHHKQRGRFTSHKKNKSPVQSWAEREIEIACKQENPDWDGKSFDYGCSVYQSVLKAYNSLINDDHSGFSWSIATEILYRLMRHRPLTSITDEDFYQSSEMLCESEEDLKKRGLKSSIQCPRMSSLFKTETLNGKVTYTDVDRYYCFNINDPNDTYQGGGAANILDELFPITMPYYPSTKRYAIACEDFLVDKEMGDFDTKAYWYIIKPNNERVEINKFFKEIKDGEPITKTIEYEHFVPDENNKLIQKVDQEEHTYQPTKWIEISREEFEERKKNKLEDIN